MKALAIAATGMNAQQTNLEVIANNIANINTTGFKRARAEFSDLLYQTERAAVQWYVETLAFGLRAADKAPALEAIAKAIAVKRGVDVEKVKAELERKVKAKKRRP